MDNISPGQSGKRRAMSPHFRAASSVERAGMVGLAASIADERPDFDGPMACADVSDPDLFFPVSRPGSRRYAQEAKPAKLICGGCPVRAECLEYALEAGEEGVWGGTDDDERRELSRQRQGVSA